MSSGRARFWLGAGLALVAALVLIVAACDSRGPATASLSGLVDSAGRRIQLSGDVQRVVSLAPSGTEILFAIGAGDLVVGVDDFSNYPSEAEAIENIGSLTPDIERLVALAPDLVVAAFITSPDDIEQLSEAGISVWVADSNDVRGVADAIRGLGAAIGRTNEAEQVARDLEAQIDSIVDTVSRASSRPRVFHELDASDPSKPFTVGPGSFVDDLLTLAGGENVFGDSPTPYLQVGLEEVLARNPEAIVLGDAPFGTTVESVRSRIGWEVIGAVQSDWMLEVSSELGDKMARPGPRIGDALEAVARFLHPDLFE